MGPKTESLQHSVELSSNSQCSSIPMNAVSPFRDGFVVCSNIYNISVKHEPLNLSQAVIHWCYKKLNSQR